MVTKKLTYWAINSLMSFIDGQREGDNILIYGLANESITSGVAIKLNRIKKEFTKELAVLQEELNKVNEGATLVEDGEAKVLPLAKTSKAKAKAKADDTLAVEANVKRVELWNTEIEVSFEPISLSKVEDLVPTKNSFGLTPSYADLLEVISE